jgi:hypothetical protein
MNTVNDDGAIYALKTIAEARLLQNAGTLPPESDLRSLLASELGGADITETTEGDLARAALAVLAQDPDYAEPVRVLGNQPGSPRKYLEPSTILLVTAALLVLQTRVKFTLDHNRRWSAEVEKKALSDPALKSLIQRLTAFLDHRQ